MGATVDTNEKAYFISDTGMNDTGASVNGTPAFLLKNGPSHGSYVKLGIEEEKSSWLICPHLSDPVNVFNYYMSSGLIIIVMGKCFCETCLDMIIMNNDLSEFLSAGRPMTDDLFQKNIINPLIDSNYNFTRQVGYIAENEATPKTWVTCSHLSSKAGIMDVYANGGQIFIFESYFTCQDCFDKIPSDSLVDVLYEGVSMTDKHFQEQIIDPLFSINYESLKAMGHFELTLA
jgi:hypothetical protein